MTDPRAYTAEEVQEMLLDKFKHLAEYWATVDGPTSVKDRCEGLVFSILNVFDGNSADLPAFDIIPSPHESDKEYRIENGKNYFEPVVVNNCQLHEMFYD